MTPRPFRTARRLTRSAWRSKVGTWVAIASLLGIGYGSAHVLEQWDIDTPPATATPATSGVVTGYRDGDTFLSTAGPIRIFQVEAPETKAHATKCDDPALAAAAENALAALAPVGTVVGLRVTHESFDRHVAYVTLPDGTDLGDRLLATGTVTAYPSDGTCPGGAG